MEDPWLTLESEAEGGAKDKVTDTSVSSEGRVNSNTRALSEFEDQFVVSSVNVPVPLEKLPDSDTYLASLEKKLKKVQSGGGKQNSAEILRSLEETKDSYMVKLLTDNTNTALNNGQDNLDFDELKVNPILKKIAPEKQAVALEELVHLLKADQLSILLDNSADAEETGKAETEKPE